MTKCRDPSQSALEGDLLLIIILIDHAPSYFIKDPGFFFGFRLLIMQFKIKCELIIESSSHSR